MSLPVQTARADHTGNGTADEFSFTFKILSALDLRVVVRDTLGVESVLSLNTDYTVSGVGVEGGGSVTLVAGALTSGHKLAILRRKALAQETSIKNQGTFYAATHEDQFDADAMIAQQQQEQIERALKLPESVPPSEFDPEIPMDLVGAESRTLVTNADGDGWAVGPAVSTILEAASLVGDAEAAATAAAASALAADASEAAAASSAADAATSADEAETAAASVGSLLGLTPDMALQTSATGTVEVSAVTSAELAHVSGVTSAIQTQLNAKQATIAANGISNALLAQMAAATLKGNNTAGAANAADLTATQVTAMLNVFTDLLKGLVPASGGGTTNFLRADGGWAAPASATPTAPLVTRYTSGSGTHNTTGSPLYTRIRMVGGGGGGGGSGTASTNGGAGGDTTFGNHTAGGGAGGGNAGANTGGNGGTATVGSGGTTVVTAVGGRGFGQFNQNVANGVIPGGSGGSSYFGGAGGGATYNGTAVAGATNTGGGGQGGGSNNTNGVSTGPGGGAGGYVEVIILSPGSSFSYAVGAAGTAGTAGTSGIAGAAGGSGVIIVEEFYQ